MLSEGRQFIWIVSLLAAMGISLFAGEFAPPAEGPVPFRRDRIPLDVEAMRGLSKQLEALADGLSAETPAERRGAAQMLALAMALDPANAGARELVSEYQKGRHTPDEDAGQLEKSRAQLWQYIAWLETPEAGKNALALADCLKDVILVSDPKHARAGELREAGEKGAWVGWIPAISEYETKVVVKNDEPEDSETTKVEPVRKNEILLNKAEVFTLIWQRVGTSVPAKWALAPASLRMSATKVGVGEEGEHAFSVVIGSGQNGGQLATMGFLIQNLLRKQYGTVPAGVRVNITGRELEQAALTRRQLPISAPVAVLASSAITGREPGATIIGEIDENGAFRLPPSFWNQLQSLGNGDGGRLILPTAAAAYLPSLLAMENPGFFLDHEVLLAADFKELLNLAAKTPEGNLAASSAKFREIREKAGAQDVRAYIANRFVRQRLGEVLQEAPFHFSARMLLVQAGGNRPTSVPKTVLAAELQRAIEPMAWLFKTPIAQLGMGQNAKIGQTFDDCRTRVDGLERYAEKNDRVLVEHVREMIGVIRNLEKATRSRGDSYEVQEALITAQADLAIAHKEVFTELAAAAGDVESESP